MSKRDEELKKDGWIRQFVADEPRLSEMVEMYCSIGHEVRLEPVLSGEEAKEDECGDCRICFEGQPEGKYMVIYTRPKSGETDEEIVEKI